MWHCPGRPLAEDFEVIEARHLQKERKVTERASGEGASDSDNKQSGHEQRAARPRETLAMAAAIQAIREIRAELRAAIRLAGQRPRRQWQRAVGGSARRCQMGPGEGGSEGSSSADSSCSALPSRGSGGRVMKVQARKRQAGSPAPGGRRSEQTEPGGERIDALGL